MRTCLILITCLAPVLTGCQTGPHHLQTSQLGHLNLGMPKTEAVRLLGKPLEVATYETIDGHSPTGWSTKEVLRYAQVTSGSHRTGNFVVIFQDGKVQKYGPETGHLRDELEGVFQNPEATGSEQ